MHAAQISKEKSELNDLLIESDKRVKALIEANAIWQQKYKCLEKNTSAILNTAKNEIARKDERIKNLQKRYICV